MSQRTKVIAAVGLTSLMVVGLVLYFLQKSEPLPPVTIEETAEEITAPEETDPVTQLTIGTSVEGRTIEAYRFGSGGNELLFVGGIHGGYEWNSVLLAYQMIDYLTLNPTLVPEDVTVSIIPNLNPDGVYEVLGTEGRFTAADVTETGSLADGRFNANGIDLNRNFGCNWAPTSTWRSQTVSAGTAAFSEPEAAALRDYVFAHQPQSVTFWHSQANAVYGSECNDGILPGTVAVMNTYAGAANYKAVPTFDAYKVTGDAEGWLASIGIPAITVELATHETIEWEKNVAGTMALIKATSEQSLAR